MPHASQARLAEAWAQTWTFELGPHAPTHVRDQVAAALAAHRTPADAAIDALVVVTEVSAQLAAAGAPHADVAVTADADELRLDVIARPTRGVDTLTRADLSAYLAIDEVTDTWGSEILTDGRRHIWMVVPH